jgi:hypothetical protein
MYRRWHVRYLPSRSRAVAKITHGPYFRPTKKWVVIKTLCAFAATALTVQRLSAGHSDLRASICFLTSGSWASANRRARASMFFPIASYSSTQALHSSRPCCSASCLLSKLVPSIRLTSMTMKISGGCTSISFGGRMVNEREASLDSPASCPPLVFSLFSARCG